MSRAARPGSRRGKAAASGSWWRYAVLAGVLLAIAAFVIVSRSASSLAPGSASSGRTLGERGLKVGAPAPLISLSSTNGPVISLDQLRGSKVVVYFYEGGA